MTKRNGNGGRKEGITDEMIIKMYNDKVSFLGNRYRTDYQGIGLSLVSFACQYSLEQGCDGHIYLKSKTDTIQFYLGLGGKQLSEGSQTIVFDESVGQSLAATYFPGGVIQ